MRHTYTLGYPNSGSIFRDGKPFACLIQGLHEYPAKPATPTPAEIDAYAAMAARAPAALAALIALRKYVDVSTINYRNKKVVARWEALLTAADAALAGIDLTTL